MHRQLIQRSTIEVQTNVWEQLLEVEQQRIRYDLESQRGAHNKQYRRLYSHGLSLVSGHVGHTLVLVGIVSTVLRVARRGVISNPLL